MRLYFDETMIHTNSVNDEMLVFYSPKLHNAVQLDFDSAKVINFIISNSSGFDFKIDLFLSLDDQFEETNVQELIDNLISSRILFRDSFAFESSRFENFLHQIKKVSITKVYLHLTMKCNLKCTYCYNRELLGEDSVLSLDQWLRMIEQLSNMGVNTIILTGGEVLVYPNYEQIVRKINKLGMKIILLTNGTLLDTIDDSIAAMIDSVIVSLDGIESSPYRVNSENYDILKNILEYNKKNNGLTVRSVLTSKNKAEVNELKVFMEKMGIKHISASFIPSCKEEVDMVPDNNTTYFGGDYYIDELYECSAGTDIIAIDPKGDVYPCQTLMKSDFLITNILNDKWIEVINNSPITNYFSSRDINNVEGCQNCEVRHMCGGGCRAIAYNVYDNINHKIDFFCEGFKRDEINKLRNMCFE